VLPIRWLPQALDELHEIVTYIGQSSLLAADKFHRHVESSVLPLTSFPTLFRESQKIPGLREIAIGSNYIVFYRVAASCIEIVSIKHARRRFPSG